MRHYALAAFVAVLLGSALSAQTPGRATHRSGRLAVSLPESFRASTPLPRGRQAEPSPERDGVRHRIDVFADEATRRTVFVSTVSGLSLWQRVAFKRGIGYSGSSNYSYDRVALSRLPLSASFAELAGVAYEGVEEGGGEAGLLVRGCDADTCYEVAAQGPAPAGGTPSTELANLLSGVTLRR